MQLCLVSQDDDNEQSDNEPAAWSRLERVDRRLAKMATNNYMKFHTCERRATSRDLAAKISRSIDRSIGLTNVSAFGHLKYGQAP